jgi:hypothetical protein
VRGVKREAVEGFRPLMICAQRSFVSSISFPYRSRIR